ncbi:UPF0158 family protein [Phytopseudomonas dryadis]|uniref:Uncharacterized protein n=1 Tax=Phytopseudomonas dryadis TaxID=2487520 RepID=A0A4Q9R8J6_9GAMM|nr:MULTISPECIES: UPF0158 family protein [Pseudomonas]TBU96971.1 hypothetical protein DNK44_01950 [Pseudomonas dryadis]TBU99702.1 hypothetical protein DNK34_23970 [Pseudomonas dryadis]TBV12687.1 hypothetical protein DNK41_24265 [Pseudomonas sp. FRB 230]
MRTLTLDLDTLTQLINGRETLEHWLDLEAGTLLSLSPEDQGSDERQQIQLQPDRYAAVPNLDVAQRVALRETFLFTLDDLNAHPLLSAALTGRKPLRAFDYEIDFFPRLREQWYAYERKQLREYALNWLFELGLEPAPDKLPLDTRGIPKDILRRLTKNA